MKTNFLNARQMGPDLTEPAYPSDKWGNQEIQVFGLTKREYYAGLAMQGLLSNVENNKGH